MGIEPRDIIKHMQVPGRPGLYVLGPFESRVTVYSQQVRALNLVYSLVREERMKESTKVVVVGAGVAGITAAAAASFCKAEVTVLERLSEPLKLIVESEKRWLHPHIYEWPLRRGNLPDPLDADAHLPILNWQAGSVRAVRNVLLKEYERFEERFGIARRSHITDVRIAAGSTQRFSVTWSEPIDHVYLPAGRRDYTLQCDLVILAVGFGMERREDGIPLLSYWSSDRLDEEDASIAGRPKRFLVSGTGDGGLVDLLRIRFKNFSHQKMVELLTGELLDPADLESLTRRLASIEREAERAVDEGRSYDAMMAEEYQNLGRELTRRVDFSKHIKIRPDTQAVLTGLDDHPLSLKTSILNRLLYSMLPDARYIKGPWEFRPKEDGGFEVTFNNRPPEDFDEIIIRHGPEPALERDFPDIWGQCEQLRLLSGLDQTRYPIYQEFFQDASEGGASVPSVSAPFEASAGSREEAVPSPELEYNRSNVAPYVASRPSDVGQAPESDPPASESGQAASPFKTAGGLEPADETYLRRRCDAQLLLALKTQPLIAIDGDYQIGKSSLLNQAETLLPPGWQSCYFDLQGMRTDDPQLLLSEFFEQLSDSLGVNNRWRDLRARLQTQPLALLLDEFGALGQMKEQSMALITKLVWLAEKLPEQVRVVVCLPLPIDRFVKQFDGNPKFSERWHTISVRPFESPEELLPIFDLLPAGAARVAKDNYETIWRMSSGNPNGLQILCDRLFHAATDEDASRLTSIINDPGSYRP